MMGLYLEEVEIGQEIQLGSYHFTYDNIIDFARKFDPQPFHVDEVAAASSHFGGSAPAPGRGGAHQRR